MTGKPPVRLALFYAAVLAIAAGTSSQSLAQKGGGGGQAKPAPRTPVNCVIVMQYDPDRGDKKRKIAFNDELKAAADAVAGNLSKQETDAKSGVETHEYTVDKKHNFTQAFDFFGRDPKNKKTMTCCKKIEIIGHGHPDGSLDLPYNNEGADKLSEDEQKEAGADSLGGKYKDLQAAGGVGPKWFKQFTDKMKAALCPEIKEEKEANADDKPTVVFDSCYTAKEGSGIAEQVHDATGVKTAGFTHTCDFPYDEGTKKAAGLPVPRKGSSSEYKEFKEKAKTDDGSGMYFPGTPGGGGKTYTVTFVDSGETCTFGRSEAIATPLTPTDDKFDPLPGERIPGATPQTPIASIAPTSPVIDKAIETTKTSVEEAKQEEAKQPAVSDLPKTPAEEPKTPEAPKKPEQPTTAEKPPEQPPTTTEATPTDDVVILFKGNQAVLEQGQTGEALKGEHVMLVFQKPDAPGTRNAKKDDSGFDKDGVRGVTGPDGQVKLTVPAEDRALYLSSLGDKPNKHYRIDANAMKNTGSVGEVARNAKPDLTGGAPNGGKVAAETFKIGERTFVRRLYIAPYNATVVVLSGDKIDWCRVVEPAPGLGAEPANPSVLHRELPEAALRLPKRRSAR